MFLPSFQRQRAVQPGGGNGLLNGLVSYWKIEANGNDSVGSNSMANVGTGPTYGVGGIFANCGTFSTGNNLRKSGSSGITLANDVTIAAWVYTTQSIAGHFYGVLNKLDTTTGGYPTTGYEYALTNAGAGLMGFQVQDQSGNFPKANASTFGGLGLNTWYFICAQYDNTNKLLKISINNGAFDTQAMTDFAKTGMAAVGLGADGDPAGGTNWVGRLNEMGFWSRLLSASDITAVWNGGAGLPFPSFTH